MPASVKKTATKSAAKKRPQAKVGETAARVAAMKLEVFRLLKQGLSCPEIAHDLGISRQRAYQLASEELEAVKAETKDAALDWRVLLTARQEARLRELQALAIKAVAKNDIGAAVGAIDKQRAVDVEIGKLWGAYAPVKGELSGPDGGPLQTTAAFAVPLGTVDAAAWAAAAVAQSAGEEAEAERVLGGK